MAPQFWVNLNLSTFIRQSDSISDMLTSLALSTCGCGLGSPLLPTPMYGLDQESLAAGLRAIQE